jgi:hypothetical protein
VRSAGNLLATAGTEKGTDSVDSIENLLRTVSDWVGSHPGTALLVGALWQAVVVGFAVSGWSRSRHLARRQAKMLRGVSGESLERMLLDYAAGSEDIRTRLAAVERLGAANQEGVRTSLRRIGLVRYDAFEQIGGHQSFSLALLDDQSTGLVFTALVSRQDARVYAKTVVGGVSEQRLTPEEASAVADARLLAASGGR